MELTAKKDYVASYLNDLKNEKEAKFNTDTLEQIEELGNGSYVAYLTTKSSLTVGSRDFCYIVSQYNLKNGDIVIVKNSIDHKDKKKGKNMRGTLAEMVLIQATSDTKVLVTSVYELDMNGNIPPAKMKTIVEKQVEEFSTYKNAIDG